MVRKKGSLILCGAFLFVVWNALLLLYLWGRPPVGNLGEAGGGAEPGGKEEWGGDHGARANLAGEVIRLAEEVEAELETQKKLLKQIESHRSLWAQRKDLGKRAMDDGVASKQQKHPEKQPPGPPLPPKDPLEKIDQIRAEHSQELNPVPDPDQKAGQIQQQPVLNNELETTITSPQIVIPILVIACDRVTVRRSLDRLIQYRPSAKLFPIIVSQDCGHAETVRVIGSYGDQVTHIRQPDLSDIRVRPEHRKFQGYYKISRHYRWALNQVFNTFSHSTVVIVEDDLEVLVDFVLVCLSVIQWLV